MHGALVMLFACQDDAAIGLGCFLLSRSISVPILCCIAMQKLLVFAFPRIKLNAIKLNVMMRACKSLCCRQINENLYVGSITAKGYNWIHITWFIILCFISLCYENTSPEVVNS